MEANNRVHEMMQFRIIKNARWEKWKLVQGFYDPTTGIWQTRHVFGEYELKAAAKRALYETELQYEKIAAAYNVGKRGT
jgi:hypothetical protein